MEYYILNEKIFIVVYYNFILKYLVVINNKLFVYYDLKLKMGIKNLLIYLWIYY